MQQKSYKIQRKTKILVQIDTFQFDNDSANKTIGLRRKLEGNMLDRGVWIHCKEDKKLIRNLLKNQNTKLESLIKNQEKIR